MGRLGSCVCVTLFTTGVTLLYYCCYYCTTVARVCVPLWLLSPYYCACGLLRSSLLQQSCNRAATECTTYTLALVSLLLCLRFSSQQLGLVCLWCSFQLRLSGSILTPKNNRAATELQQSCNRVYYVYSGACLLTYSCVSSMVTGLLDLKSYVSSCEVLNLLAFVVQKHKF